MPRTRINCPNCRQPIIADLEQLFDLSVDPTAKQKLLSGLYNVVQCPHCGFQGNLSTPIVYHDPQKELLLTYFPPEVNLPQAERERLLGSLINQVVSKLPQEKRKGYLLRPQSVLTMQGMLERILEADGITREMIQAQQAKLNLIQRLLNTPPGERETIIQQEDELLDAEFFSLLTRLIEAALASGDQGSAQALIELEKSILPLTTFGRQLQVQTKEIEAAVASLQQAQPLTREKLLDLVVSAPNDIRLSVLVSLARQGMDYIFFQMLSERIDRAGSDERARLIQLRERLLELTRRVDQQLQERAGQAREILNQILQAQDIRVATIQSLPLVDEFFLQELNNALEDARRGGNLEQISKLQQVLAVIQEASTPSPEIAFLEELVDAPDTQSLRQMMEANRDKITPEFLEALTNILAQVEGNQDQELVSRIREIHRIALRQSMETGLKG